MPHLDLHDAPILTKKDLLWPFYCAKPTVKILCYTDSTSVQMDKSTAFGLGILQDWIQAANPFYATFQLELLNRHNGGHAHNKLTAALLSGYDQVWFFGILQCNVTGQAENELTAPEITALHAWMDAGGGVLMTGDHANPRPFNASAGLDPLLNLGRAIGKGVPRAGQLRKWEGLPDASFSDNHNTMVPTASLPDLNTGGQPQQSDNVPQQLILTRHTVSSWHPYFVRRRRPHPLFCGKAGLIDIFPDHMHEGLPVLPATFGADWPTGSGGLQPLPAVEAKGTDKRNGAIYPVSVAYDGDDGGVGRIVADATWHHYFNVNLQGWTGGSPAFAPDGSAAQKAIANYFQNLAVWLSPKAKRQAMRCSLWWWLVTHPEIIEVARSPYWILGGTAYDVLGRSASQCTITEFIWVDFPRHLIYERDPRHPPLPWPPEEVILGGILLEYQEAIQQATEGKPLPDRKTLQVNGFKRAAAYHVESLAAGLKGAKSAAETLEKILHQQGHSKD